jgi:hypothetical protein
MSAASAASDADRERLHYEKSGGGTIPSDPSNDRSLDGETAPSIPKNWADTEISLADCCGVRERSLGNKFSARPLKGQGLEGVAPTIGGVGSAWTSVANLRFALRVAPKVLSENFERLRDLLDLI